MREQAVVDDPVDVDIRQDIHRNLGIRVAGGAVRLHDADGFRHVPSLVVPDERTPF